MLASILKILSFGIGTGLASVKKMPAIVYELQASGAVVHEFEGFWKALSNN
jgi:hypothetical protein